MMNVKTQIPVRMEENALTKWRATDAFVVEHMKETIAKLLVCAAYNIIGS